ncbi:MAG: translation elongation factor-like protein [Candidatus Woesearchaeota archaeon]|nr:MAG: translation elongation factor-like protein [Candidatus Woesearchaeota archaeon]
MTEQEVGKIFSYYSKIGVAAIELIGELKVGDTIRIKGSTTDFTQKISSMQIEHEKVKEAGAGDSVGMKVNEKVRPNDIVYKVIE